MVDERTFHLDMHHVDANNNPTYTFDGNLTETFSADVSLLSRWQAQFGVRYIF